MKRGILKWNLGGVIAIIALLLSIKSLYDLALHFSDNSKLLGCAQDYSSVFYSLTSILGLLLGDWALQKASWHWLYVLTTSRIDTGHRYEWIAVFAVSLAIPALIMTLSSVMALSFRGDLQQGRETAAVQTLRTIHNNQAQFQVMKQRFGTLKELNKAGLIDEIYASGQTIYGYKYSSSNVTADTYCVRAHRATPICGDRDFIICEDGDFRYSQSSTITILKRGEGTLLNGQNPPPPSPMP